MTEGPLEPVDLSTVEPIDEFEPLPFEDHPEEDR